VYNPVEELNIAVESDSPKPIIYFDVDLLFIVKTVEFEKVYLLVIPE